MSDEHQRDAVDAEGVAHPELRDPGVLLHELELRVGAGLELQRRGDGEQQRDHGEAQREVLGLVGDARGQERHDERARPAGSGRSWSARESSTSLHHPDGTEDHDDAQRASSGHRNGRSRSGRGAAVRRCRRPGRPAHRRRRRSPWLSKKTSERVRWMPGRMRSALVDVVLVEVAAGGPGGQRAARAPRPGTSSRQYRSQASAVPATTSSRVSDQQDRHRQHRVLPRRLGADDRVEPGRDGAGRAEEEAEEGRARPRAPSSGPSSPAATRAGATSSVQRFLPWKVMKNRRDM